MGGELPAHSVAYFVGLEVDPRRSKEGAVLDVDKVRELLCCSLCFLGLLLDFVGLVGLFFF